MTDMGRTDFWPDDAQLRAAYRWPARLTDVRDWHGHIPFAFWLVDTMCPGMLVELGVFKGDSYCAFCQGVHESGCGTLCYGIDAWVGDIHVGSYGEDVLRELRAHHDPRYGRFSRLVQLKFDDALAHFDDDSIDLLHIDGTHTYEDVSRDFQSWLPKLSARGTVLLHDIVARQPDFGVPRMWKELRTKYPAFGFPHSHGLGVVAVGRNPPTSVQWLVGLSDRDGERLRRLFGRLGALVQLTSELDGLRSQLAATAKHEELIDKMDALGRGLSAVAEEQRNALKPLVGEMDDVGRAIARMDALARDLIVPAVRRVREAQSDEILPRLDTALQRLETSQADVRHVQHETVRLKRALGGVRRVHDGTRRQLSSARAVAGVLGDALLAAAEDVAHLSEALESQRTPQGGEPVAVPSTASPPSGGGVEATEPHPDGGDLLEEALVRAESAEQRLRETVATIHGSTSWRITGPVRWIGDTIRVIRPRAVPAPLPDVVFAIDSLVRKGTRLHGFGWLYGRSAAVVHARLVELGRGYLHYHEIAYGTDRPDVLADHPEAGQSTCGFWLSCTLHRGTSRLFMEVSNARGEQGWVPVLPTRRGPPGSRQSLSPWALVRGAVRYVLRGDLRGLFRRVVRGPVSQSTHVGPSRPLDGLRPQDALATIATRRGEHQVILIDHNLGGGTNLYREECITESRATGSAILLLYYDLPLLTYRARYCVGTEALDFPVDDIQSFAKAIVKLHWDEIVLNNLFSHEDPLMLSRLAVDLKRTTGARFVVAVHDFFCVCPSYSLLNFRGEFCGIPNVEECKHCLPKIAGEVRALVPVRDIQVWRRTWGDTLRAADTVRCFSQSSRELVCRAYPSLDAARIEVIPHKVLYFEGQQVTYSLRHGLRIGVVGTITAGKGAGFVRELGAELRRRIPDAHLTVIGTLTGSESAVGVEATGPYAREDLPRLLLESGVNMCLVPSIGPETFSYVTHELTALGMPVAAFDRGAQAEHVRGYSKGLVLSRIDAASVLDELLAFYAELCNSDGEGGAA